MFFSTDYWLLSTVYYLGLLPLLRAARLDEALARGVAGDGDVRGRVVLLADGGAALRHPDFHAGRAVARGQVADVVAVRVHRPAARGHVLAAGAERRVAREHGDALHLGEGRAGRGQHLAELRLGLRDLPQGLGGGGQGVARERVERAAVQSRELARREQPRGRRLQRGVQVLELGARDDGPQQHLYVVLVNLGVVDRVADDGHHGVLGRAL